MSVHTTLILQAVIWVIATSGLPAIGDSDDDSHQLRESPTSFPVSDEDVSVTLDVNDVSWLFPPPKGQTDLANIITLGDLNAAVDGSPVFSDDLFERFLAIADGGEFKVPPSHEIRLRPELRQKSAWKIAAFRVDPSAPGTDAAIQAVFGQIPQIRVILQPVTAAGEAVQVHDFALHVIYSYIAGIEQGPVPTIHKAVPDREAFQRIVDDIVHLKQRSATLGASTDGMPLGVHPGLKLESARIELAEAVRGFLSRHLDDQRITALAIMGLPEGDPEPWIFSAMRRHQDGPLTVEPAPAAEGGAKAQMLSFLNGLDNGEVIPAPKPTNRIPGSSGVSTAALFKPGVDLNADAVDSQDAEGRVLKNGEISDWIAHPRASHFFNTDCISCHTESSRRVHKGIEPTPVAFVGPQGISGLDAGVLPTNDRDGQWNVRNFGWFPPFFANGPAIPTATMRTLNETIDVVEAMNRDFLK